MHEKFLLSHSGKATAGVLLADALIGWPDLLSWLVAAYILYWAVGHLRQAFRSVDAANDESPPADVPADVLDVAASLDIAARGDRRVPALIALDQPACAAAPAGQEPLPAWLRLPS
jgi:hypothetical protein